MLVAPARRCRLITRFRSDAMTCGPEPVWTWDRSSAKVTSRTQCRALSGRRGALLRRAPLRTVRATRRGTRLKQPSRAGVSAVGRWAAGAVGVHEAGCRPAVVFGDRFVGERLADR